MQFSYGVSTRRIFHFESRIGSGYLSQFVVALFIEKLSRSKAASEGAKVHCKTHRTSLPEVCLNTGPFCVAFNERKEIFRKISIFSKNLAPSIIRIAEIVSTMGQNFHHFTARSGDDERFSLLGCCANNEFSLISSSWILSHVFAHARNFHLLWKLTSFPTNTRKHARISLKWILLSTLLGALLAC